MKFAPPRIIIHSYFPHTFKGEQTLDSPFAREQKGLQMKGASNHSKSASCFPMCFGEIVLQTTSKSGGATVRKIIRTLNFRKPKTHQENFTPESRGGFGTLHGMQQLQPGTPFKEEE